MKKFNVSVLMAVTISLFYSLNSFSNESEKLLPGECLAQVYTKKYLNFEDRENSKDHANKMHYIYTCDYTCIDNDKNKYTVQARHEKRVYNEAEMARSVVCDGVIMKEIRTAALSYYDFSHVERFYSRDSALKEIKSWAKREKIPSFSLRLSLKIKRVKKAISNMNKAYQKSLLSLKNSNQNAYRVIKGAVEENNYFLKLKNVDLYNLILKHKKNKKSSKSAAVSNLIALYNLK